MANIYFLWLKKFECLHTHLCFLSFQSQVIEFQWKDIQGYDIEEEGMVFQFEYNRPGKKPRIVQILTQYVSTETGNTQTQEIKAFWVQLVSSYHLLVPYFSAPFWRRESILLCTCWPVSLDLPSSNLVHTSILGSRWKRMILESRGQRSRFVSFPW